MTKLASKNDSERTDYEKNLCKTLLDRQAKYGSPYEFRNAYLQVFKSTKALFFHERKSDTDAFDVLIIYLILLKWARLSQAGLESSAGIDSLIDIAGYGIVGLFAKKNEQLTEKKIYDTLDMVSLTSYHDYIDKSHDVLHDENERFFSLQILDESERFFGLQILEALFFLAWTFN